MKICLWNIDCSEFGSNKFNKIAIYIVMLSFGCSNSNESWEVMNLSSFEISVPKGFEYRQIQGIDSYIGEITNDSISISFDHGWYTNSGPNTLIDELFKSSNMWHNDVLLQKIRKISTEPLGINVMDSIHIVKIATYKSDDTLRYEIALKFDMTDSIRTINLNKQEIKWIDYDYEKYDIEYSYEDCNYRKIFISNDGSNNAGVNLFKDCNYKENIGMLTILGVFVNSRNQIEMETIDSILRSVVLLKD